MYCFPATEVCLLLFKKNESDTHAQRTHSTQEESQTPFVLIVFFVLLLFSSFSFSSCQGFSLRGLTLKVAVPGIDTGALLSLSQQHAAAALDTSSPEALKGQLREARSAGIAALRQQRRQQQERWRREQRVQTVTGEEALEFALAAAGIYFQFFGGGRVVGGGGGGAALPLPVKALLAPVFALEKYLTKSVAVAR